MVPRFPTLLVSSFLMLLGGLALVTGLVMDGIRKSRHDLSRLSYLRHPAVRLSFITTPN